MNNKGMLIGVVALLVIAGAAFLIFSSDMEMSEEELVRQALAGSGSASCTFVDQETGEEGQMYIKDGNMRSNMRAEITLDPQGEPELKDVNMLMLDQEMFVWADGELQGMRFSFAEMDDFDEIEHPLQDIEDEERFRDEYEAAQFSCTREDVDESLFEVPDSVEFMDISTLMQPMEPNAEIPEGMEEFMEEFGEMDDMDVEQMEEMMEDMEAEFMEEMR